jgi:anaerobic magnesium-protoporphyrin IX monomethyl ester cyclase
MLFHPLGIAQLAAVLRGAGADVTVVDCTFREREDVLAEMQDSQPRIVGIYVMVSMSDNARDLARALRQRLPHALFATGGPLPTLRPERFAEDFDLVFRGEAAYPFPRFCTDYLNGSPSSVADLCRNAEEYPGIYRECSGDGSVLQSEPQSLDEAALDRMPMPDRSDYDHRSYQRFWMQRDGLPAASIMTSYGCPYECDFCSKPVFGNWFRRRSVDRIVEEIWDIKGWGYDALWIGDDCFTLDMEHVRACCQRLIDEELKVKWRCLSRAEGVEAGDVQLMRRAGCEKVYFGLESGSDEVLKLMNKRTTVEAAERTVRLFSRGGIRTAGFFMVGYPGETCQTIERTFAWALSLPLDEISFTVPYPLPGTRLFDKVSGVREDTDWQYENENRLFYQSDFDERYLRRRIEETYASFESNRRAVAR